MKINKKVIITCTSIIIILSILIVGLYIITDKKNNKESFEKIYGTVVNYDKGLLKVKTLDNKELTVISNAQYDKGDFIVVEYYKVGKDLLTTIDLIAEDSEIKEMKEESTTTTKVITKKTTTSKKSSKSTTTTTIKISDKDAMIVEYLNESNEEVGTYKSEESFKDKAKNKAITLIDFIFYDKDIKGVKFSELKENTKAKVVYYTLVIDNKINDLFPDYKDNISNVYENAKSELLATYFDLATKVCDKNKEQCEIIKNDATALKTKVSITWENIKESLIYGKDKTISTLKNWYEIWSGK